ncbi:MAG: TauD/TfdA family dioxygenase [Pseudomonadota bacterium]
MNRTSASCDCIREDDGLRLHWRDGHESFFHFVWLRDCCYCETCGDSYSSNRFLQPCDVALDSQPDSVVVDNAELQIVWRDEQHHSTYSLDWLRDHCYSKVARESRIHRPIFWDASIADHLPEVQFEAACQDAGGLELCRKLRDYGFVVVRNGPAKVSGTETIAQLIGEVTDSAYGKFFDLSPKSTIKTLGNTLHPVQPHTDEAYRHNPTGVNVLHCLRPADEGGESVLVDGFYLGDCLRSANPDSFRLLVEYPQSFNRVTHGGDHPIHQCTRAPVYTVDENDNIVGFRFHTRSTGPLDVPADAFLGVYAANRTLSEMMLEAENQAVFRLEAGDAVMFDNQRVMHSRRGFSDHQRKLRICNVTGEQFHERLRMLAYRLGFAEESQQILAAGVCG